MELNFNGVTYGEIFGIPKERFDALLHTLADAGMEINENFHEYEFESDQLNDNAVHVGKVLKRMLRDISEENERLFVISTTDGLIDVINRKKSL